MWRIPRNVLLGSVLATASCTSPTVQPEEPPKPNEPQRTSPEPLNLLTVRELIKEGKAEAEHFRRVAQELRDEIKKMDATHDERRRELKKLTDQRIEEERRTSIARKELEGITIGLFGQQNALREKQERLASVEKELSQKQPELAQFQDQCEKELRELKNKIGVLVQEHTQKQNELTKLQELVTASRTQLRDLHRQRHDAEQARRVAEEARAAAEKELQRTRTQNSANTQRPKNIVAGLAELDKTMVRQLTGQESGHSSRSSPRERVLANPRDDEAWGALGDAYAAGGKRNLAYGCYTIAFILGEDDEWQRKRDQQSSYAELAFYELNVTDDEFLGNLGDLCHSRLGWDNIAQLCYAAALARDTRDSEWPGKLIAGAAQWIVYIIRENQRNDEAWGDLGDAFARAGYSFYAQACYAVARLLDSADSEWKGKAPASCAAAPWALRVLNIRDDEWIGDLGDTAHGLGDREGARELYTLASQLDPSDNEWQRKLSRRDEPNVRSDSTARPVAATPAAPPATANAPQGTSTDRQPSGAVRVSIPLDTALRSSSVNVNLPGGSTRPASSVIDGYRVAYTWTHPSGQVYATLEGAVAGPGTWRSVPVSGPIEGVPHRSPTRGGYVYP